jgi:phosphate/sulfate permease
MALVSLQVISWFTSPILSGIVAAGLFLFTRHAGAPVNQPNPARLTMHAPLLGTCFVSGFSAHPCPAPLLPVGSSCLLSCRASPAAVLRRRDSYTLSLYMLPLFTFITIWVGVFFIVEKAPKLVRLLPAASSATLPPSKCGWRCGCLCSWQ